MSKIGTAHVEIKPVLNEDSLREITERIEREIGEAMERGFLAHYPQRYVTGPDHE